MKDDVRRSEQYHDGTQEGLTPLEPVDLSKIKDLDDLLRAYSKASFGARTMGEGADTLYQMVKDPETFVVLTLSGAMTPAKMGLVIVDMIERGYVHAIVSTGALMTHGFVEGSGRTHFKHDPRFPDTYLFQHGYNRIYDTIELEKNLDDVEEITHEVVGRLDASKPLGSMDITRLLGAWLNDNVPGRSILKSAYQRRVPVYIPAFSDCELGLNFQIYNMIANACDKRQIRFDPFLDNYHYMEMIARQKRLGIFTVGGGVPRNWAQQVAPLLDLVQKRMPAGTAPAHLTVKKFAYAVRICPDPVHFGSLSGCSYSEGVSWGKFVPENDGGQFTEIPTDATIAWPMIVGGVIQRLAKDGITRVAKNFCLESQMAQAEEAIRVYR